MGLAVPSAVLLLLVLKVLLHRVPRCPILYEVSRTHTLSGPLITVPGQFPGMISLCPDATSVGSKYECRPLLLELMKPRGWGIQELPPGQEAWKGTGQRCCGVVKLERLNPSRRHQILREPTPQLCGEDSLQWNPTCLKQLLLKKCWP